jgi:hypothetical protein
MMSSGFRRDWHEWPREPLRSTSIPRRPLRYGGGKRSLWNGALFGLRARSSHIGLWSLKVSFRWPDNAVWWFGVRFAHRQHRRRMAALASQPPQAIIGPYLCLRSVASAPFRLRYADRGASIDGRFWFRRRWFGLVLMESFAPPLWIGRWSCFVSGAGGGRWLVAFRHIAPAHPAALASGSLRSPPLPCPP